MQIREKGRKVLCIRTEYVPEKKRTFGRTVASQESYLSTVSKEVRQQLSEEEVDQLKKWLSEREANEAVDSLERKLSIVASVMTGAADALEVDSIREGLSAEQADAIWQAHERLSKALRRHGFKKPKAPAKPRAEQQSSLPLMSDDTPKGDKP